WDGGLPLGVVARECRRRPRPARVAPPRRPAKRPRPERRRSQRTTLSDSLLGTTIMKKYCLVFLALIGAVAARAAETGPWAGRVVVAARGQGGRRFSKVNRGGPRGAVSRLTESKLNLRVAVNPAKLLKKTGAPVHMPRLGDHRLSREGSSNSHELHA